MALCRLGALFLGGLLAGCAATDPSPPTALQPSPATITPAARCPETLGAGLGGLRLDLSPGSDLSARLEGQFTPVVATGTRLSLRYCTQRAALVSLYADLPNPDRGRPAQPERVVVRLFENRPAVAGEVAAFPGLGDPDIRFSFPGANAFLLVVSTRNVHFIEPSEVIDASAMPRLRLSRTALEGRLRERLSAASANIWELLQLETRVQAGAAASLSR